MQISEEHRQAEMHLPPAAHHIRTHRGAYPQTQEIFGRRCAPYAATSTGNGADFGDGWVGVEAASDLGCGVDTDWIDGRAMSLESVQTCVGKV